MFIGLVYWIFVRPQHINWGATSTEINRRFPIDEFISPDRIVSTRAIIMTQRTKSGTFAKHTKPTLKSQPCKRACLVPALLGTQLK